MANLFAPFGFRPVNTSGGAGVNWKLSTRRIQSSNATAIYKGDAVVQDIGPANGYIQQASAASSIGQPLAGIFWGCEYLSVSQKRVVWNQYWPGSDAQGDVTAFVIDSPESRFVVQTSGGGFQVTSPTNFVSSPVGELCNLNPGTGSTLTAQSGMFVDSIGTTASFPFIITDMVLDPPGSNGTDATNVFNYVVVGFNNQWLRSNAALAGIA